MQYPAWYSLWNFRRLDRFQSPKILTQVLAPRATFALDPDGSFWFVGGGNAGVYGIIPKNGLDVDIWYLLGVLNSGVFDETLQRVSSRFRGGFYSYAKRFIEIVPVRVDGFTANERDTVKLISELAKTLHQLRGDLEEANQQINALARDLYH